MRRLRLPLAVLAALLVALVALGPYEPVAVDVRFDPARLSGGVSDYLTEREAQVPGLRPGAQKRVIWARAPEERTDLALVYFHGFSSGPEEIRPVPDEVAAALGANLVYTRFAGHGRDGAALAEARVQDWMTDAAEALAIGRAVGREVVVIATSTGGTIAAAAAAQPRMARDVKGVVLVSPNFGLRDPRAPLLTWPGARYWLPLVAGRTRSFEPLNAAQARHWTTEYPVAALFPMAAIVRHVSGLDHGQIGVPALLYYADADTVVDPAATDEVMEAWGGPVTRAVPELGAGVDPKGHIVAGDILSPANTQAAARVMTDWIRGLD